MASDFEIKSDILKFDLEGLSPRELGKAVQAALTSQMGVLQQRYSRGQKPDGTSQKNIGNTTESRRGGKHHKAGRSSELSDVGDLRKSMKVDQQGVKNGAKLFFSGTHPTGKLNAQIAKDLNDKGFKNTYLTDKDMDNVTSDVVEELMQQHLKNLVQIDKKGK
jgi:hypothetical protein